MRQFVNIGYDRPIPVVPGVTLTFYDAGHILGAAQVCLDIEDREDGRKKRFLFSGDVGRGVMNFSVTPCLFRMWTFC